MPTLLVAKRTHPLFALGDSLTLQDALRFPLLPLSELAFPVFQKNFYGMGFSYRGSLVSEGVSKDSDHAWLPLEDIYLGVASPLTLGAYESDWEPLPLFIPITVGDAMVACSHYATHPRTCDLLSRLGSHLVAKAGTNKDVSIAGGLGERAAEPLICPIR
jgi:hypothetical protein